MEAEVCVIGGGLAGITTALELLRLGRSVIVLEARKLGWGASGRNGGVVSPGYSAGWRKIAKTTGTAQANALHRLSIEGVAMVAENIKNLNLQSAAKVVGGLRVCRYPNGDALRAEQQRLEDDFNYAVVFKSREEIASLLCTPQYHAGLYDPQAFHFHPLNYLLGLADEIESLGGRLYEDSEVLSVPGDAAGKIVKTAHGQVKARHLVFAGGGYTGNVVPQLARSYLPIATYMLLTEAAAEQIGTAIRTDASVGDDRRASDYYRVVDAGRRILWGGMITTQTTEPRRMAEQLRQRMVGTYPQLEGLKVDLAWSGWMAYARHLMPQIGQLEPGLWYCTGFGGHGMNTSAIGGRVVAEAIAQVSERYKLFSPFGLPWNGGVLGTAAVQLTYWRYRMMDFIKEKL